MMKNRLLRCALSVFFAGLGFFGHPQSSIGYGNTTITGAPVEGYSPLSYFDYPSFEGFRNNAAPFSFGQVLLGFSGFYEIGSIDKLLERYNDIKEKLADNSFYRLENVEPTLDLVLDSSKLLDQHGYVIAEGTVFPLFPMVWKRGLDSIFTLNFSYTYGGRVRFVEGSNPASIDSKFNDCLPLLEDPSNAAQITACINQISSDTSVASCIDLAQGNTLNALAACDVFRIESDSSVNVQTVRGINLGMAFGGNVGTINFPLNNAFSGVLKYGLNVDYHRLTVAQTYFVYSNEVLSTDVIERIQESETSASVWDVKPSFNYITRTFNLFFGIEHFLSPTLKYKEKEQKLPSNPFVSGTFHGLFGEAQSDLAISFYLDLSKSTTLYGTENRWFLISASYSPETWFLPDIRFGRRFNLIREKLNYTQIGFSVARNFDFNLSFSGEDVEYNGTTFPRSAMLSFSFYSSI